jgi:hypothetical protein
VFLRIVTKAIDDLRLKKREKNQLKECLIVYKPLLLLNINSV